MIHGLSGNPPEKKISRINLKFFNLFSYLYFYDIFCSAKKSKNQKYLRIGKISIIVAIEKQYQTFM